MVKYLLIFCAAALVVLWVLFKIAKKLFKLWMIVLLLIATGAAVYFWRVG